VHTGAFSRAVATETHSAFQSTLNSAIVSYRKPVLFRFENSSELYSTRLPNNNRFLVETSQLLHLRRNSVIFELVARQMAGSRPDVGLLSVTDPQRQLKPPPDT